ncbi:MAG: PAS domain S-box protein [Anaerolineae bacterium]|nr:PAS domain S-box protein [Anaerolineae bacterium]
MNTVSFLRLVQNAALLLSLVLVFDVFALRWRAGQDAFSRNRLIAGLIIGAIGVVVMLTPWVLLPGLVFDTRSVLLSISGLFFGAAPTLIAMVITAALRLYQGGPGVWPGVSTVLVTGSLGLFWRRMYRGKLDQVRLTELYLFGLVTHLIMLLLMFTLPLEMALHTLRNISAPVLIVYPLASTLLGGLMVNRLKREKLIDERQHVEEALRAERQLLRTLIDNLPDAIYAKDAQGRKTLANRTDLNNIGLPEAEVLGKTDAEVFPPEIAASFMADDAAVLKTGVQVLNREELLFNIQGKRLWQLTSKLPLRDADDQIVGLVGIGRNVTESKQAEEALRAERDLVRRIMETSPAGITMVNKAGQIVFANPQAEQVLGLRRDQIHQRTYNDPQWRITDYDGGPFPEEGLPFVQVQRTLRPVSDVRHAIEWPDGRRVLLRINAAPLLDEQGAFNGIVASTEDVTEHRQRELERATLLEAEREQRLRAETLSDVTLALASALDVPDVLVEILHQAQRLVPSTASSIALVENDALHIVGRRGYTEYSAEQELAGTHQPLSDYPINAELVAGGEPYITADTYNDSRWQRRPANAWIRAHISLPISLGEGVLGVLRLDSEQVGTFSMQDVERLRPLTRAAAIALENAQLYTQAQRELAERTRSQAALEASEHKFREMLENMRLFAVTLDLEGRVTFCNDFGLQLVGMQWEAVLGCDWFETFVPPEIRDEMRAAFLKNFSTGNFPAHFENEILTAGGTTRALIAWNNMVVRDTDHNVVGVSSIGEDITARRQAERALLESEAWLRSFVDSMDDVIFSLDTQQRHTALYGRWLERIGMSPEHFLGRTAREVFGPEAARVHETANIQALETATSVTYEWELNDGPEGRQRFQTTLSPLRGPEGEVTGLVGVGRDITALKDYQAQLQTALDEKTLMLSEIHHRIKNNLQVILGLLELQFATVEDEGTQQMLRESQNRIKAIALIHERLYQTPGESQINARLYIQSLTRYLTETYNAMVRGIVVEHAIADMELDIDVAIPCALIVNELIANALKYAFPPTWQSPSGAPPTLRVALYRTGDHGRLEVADNGVGLPADAASETSPRLGLRLIKMLARQIDGELHIEQNEGTCVAVTFARSEDK